MLPIPPRLYAITATRAPVALVFRKAAGWWSLHRWQLDDNTLHHGAWFRGTLYPRRADLSPDGRFLSYFALKASRTPFLSDEHVKTYCALSHAPWLHALVAWKEYGTWTRGLHFVPASERDMEDPTLGDLALLARRHNLSVALTRSMQYAVERRRGWTDHEDCPPRADNDMWDERRAVVLTKPRPEGKGRLVLNDQGWAANAPDRIEGRRPRFHVEKGRTRIELPEAMWADWDAWGRLLVATDTGRLQVRDLDNPNAKLREHDLSALTPAPQRAPAWALGW